MTAENCIILENTCTYYRLNECKRDQLVEIHFYRYCQLILGGSKLKRNLTFSVYHASTCQSHPSQISVNNLPYLAEVLLTLVRPTARATLNSSDFIICRTPKNKRFRTHQQGCPSTTIHLVRADQILIRENFKSGKRSYLVFARLKGGKGVL